MTESLRLRPDNDRLLGNGKLLNLLGQIKALLGAFPVEISRLNDILGLYQTVVDADYHAVEGARKGLTAAVDIADILVLEDDAVNGIKELLASDAALGLFVWLYNVATGYEGVLEMRAEPISIPDLSKFLPLLLQIIELIKLLRG